MILIDFECFGDWDLVKQQEGCGWIYRDAMSEFEWKDNQEKIE